MTRALITIDTELSAGRQRAGMALADNFAGSILGRTAAGDYGISWLMDCMDRRGLTGVFFVDPLPALIHGPDIVARIVEPIVARGHEVQIHVHTEWLAWAGSAVAGGRQGRNIGDFALADQVALIDWARGALVAAGAPAPVAFRAGNYGANDDTLRALATLGIVWDSSFNADYAGRDCGITLPRESVAPVAIGTVWEVPVSVIEDRPGHLRPAQVCAMSSSEMRAALRHAAQTGAHSLVVVSHSFEMLSRDRMRPNRLVMARFEALCDAIATEGLASGGFADLTPPVSSAATPASNIAPPDRTRTFARIVEQGWGALRYERSWGSA